MPALRWSQTGRYQDTPHAHSHCLARCLLSAGARQADTRTRHTLTVTVWQDVCSPLEPDRQIPGHATRSQSLSGKMPALRWSQTGRYQDTPHAHSHCLARCLLSAGARQADTRTRHTLTVTVWQDVCSPLEPDRQTPGHATRSQLLSGKMTALRWGQTGRHQDTPHSHSHCLARYLLSAGARQADTRTRHTLSHCLA
ncbi:hypothetical protein RRG08_035580 [Elysia crispata]|uniref:Uncharacterized protein n=1 Tax=Elysia crispata TaxID=231223 RepID=A0AAE1EAX7_9GAST|nr:hypothetical protein RRG08_035580 [Elysia crispata]